MQQIIKFLIGILVLALGFPLGLFLSSRTKDEMKQGQKWFKLLIVLSLCGGVISLILGNDILMFTVFFIAIVTSGSLRKK